MKMKMTTQQAVKPNWLLFRDDANHRRELWVVPAYCPSPLTPIARYELPWDDPGDVAKNEAIARARREHGCC
jgi:hypothetical protein